MSTDNDASKIVLRKNEDGSVTKVVIKKVKKKVKLKVAPKAKLEAGQKPLEKGTQQNKSTSQSTSTSGGAQGNRDKAHQGTGGQRRSGPGGPPGRNRPGQGQSSRTGQQSRPGNNGGAGQGGGAGKKGKIFLSRQKINETKAAQEAQKTRSDQRRGTNVAKKAHTDAEKKDREENLGRFDSQVRFRKDRDEFANVPSKIEVPPVVSIKDLAHKLNLKSSQLIKKFFSLGVMDLTVNDSIDAESATIVCQELGCEIKVASLEEQTKVDVEKGEDADYVPRSPVVTVMGHVDHGKTSLLDSIRNENVVSGESGGITQHVGAYKVKVKRGEVLFIDTPGHAAFSAMRARGANITDLVILVVSATDGVMPQTIEAINHAKAANVPIIVAVNKCDLPEANPDRAKQQLAEHGLVAESYGGEVLFHEVSALKKTGIEELLDSIVLQAELNELKGNPKVRAYGFVIESKIETGRGNVATVVIKNGTLRKGDAYLCARYYGKVRAMFNDRGKQIKEAGPSTPIEIIGIQGLLEAGEIFQIMSNEKEAKKVADSREQLYKERAAQKVKKVTMSNLFDTLKAGSVEEFKVLVKGDVFGSVEAIKDTLNKQQNDEVKVTVIHAATGGITENDVNLASASDAAIIGFKVRPNASAKKLAEHEGVKIHMYQVIYDIIDYVQERLQGMLKAETIESNIGAAEVKEVFKISGVGKIAGCVVTEGKVLATSKVRIFRQDTQLHEGSIKVLKRYKDEVKEVFGGQECGIQIEDFDDLRAGDTIEVVQVTEVERKLKIQDYKAPDESPSN